MESKTMSSILRLACILVFLTGFTASDIDKDKEKCANQVAGLVTCLPYVSGEAKAPPKECCTGLKQVIQTSPECICLLVKDKDDPSLGLKINATLALSLPSQCQAPANISDCPRLLHLPPNSPDAKVFDDFANSANKTNIAPAPAATDMARFKLTFSNLRGAAKAKRAPERMEKLCIFVQYKMDHMHSLPQHLKIWENKRLDLVHLGHYFNDYEIIRLLRDSLPGRWKSIVDEIFCQHESMLLSNLMSSLIKRWREEIELEMKKSLSLKINSSVRLSRFTPLDRLSKGMSNMISRMCKNKELDFL